MYNETTNSFSVITERGIQWVNGKILREDHWKSKVIVICRLVFVVATIRTSKVLNFFGYVEIEFDAIKMTVVCTFFH